MEIATSPGFPKRCVSIYMAFQDLLRSLNTWDIQLPEDATNMDSFLQSLLLKIGQICRHSSGSMKAYAETMMKAVANLSRFGIPQTESVRFMALAYSIPLRREWIRRSDSTAIPDYLETDMLRLARSVDIHAFFHPPGVEEPDMVLLLSRVFASLQKRPLEVLLIYKATLWEVMRAFRSHKNELGDSRASFPLFDLVHFLHENIASGDSSKSAQLLMMKIKQLASSSEWRRDHSALLRIMSLGDGLIGSFPEKRESNELLYLPHTVFVVIEVANLPGTVLAEALTEIAVAIVETIRRFPTDEAVFVLHTMAYRRVSDIFRVFLERSNSNHGVLSTKQLNLIGNEAKKLIDHILRVFPFRS